MTRLERKCFIGSAAFHGLLLVIFLFGSAFLSSKPEKPMPVITIVNLNGKVTDQKISTGGSPQGNPTPPPAQVTPAQPPPPVEPPKVEVKKAETEPPKKEVVKKPEPRKVETKKEIVKETPKEKGDIPVKKETKKTPDKTKDLAENTKPTRTINTNIVRRPNSELIAAQIAAQKRVADEKAAREYAQQMAAYQRDLQARNSQIGSVIDGVGKNLGNKTVTVPYGPGGEAYVHYGSLIGEIYKRAVYASRPEGDEDAVAVIRIVVTRSGSVKDAEWVRKTGISVLDRAVDRAIKTVRSVPAFPEGSTDSERTFTLNIGFEAKRVST